MRTRAFYRDTRPPRRPDLADVSTEDASARAARKRLSLRLVGFPLVAGAVALNYWLVQLVDRGGPHPIRIAEILVALGSLACALTGIFLLVLGKKIFPRFEDRSRHRANPTRPDDSRREVR